MKANNDEKFDVQPGEQFAKDLQTLFEPTEGVRPEVDRAVMDAAARHLHRRRGLRWLTYGGACAAAAMLVAGVLLMDLNRQKHPHAPIALKNDMNADGSVDILDAFKLARQIGATDEPDPAWDANGDGFVDQKDVDAVAFAAVQLNEGVL